MRVTVTGLLFSLFVCIPPCLAGDISLPDSTLTANDEVSLGIYGAGLVTTEGLYGQDAPSQIHGFVTGITDHKRSWMQIGLIPRSAWDPNSGAWNVGAYATSWYAQPSDGLSLGADGVGGPYVWPLDEPNATVPWEFTIDVTPSGAVGGTVVIDIVGETLEFPELQPLVYTSDLSDAILAAQFISEVQGAQFSFTDVTATGLTTMPGDVNDDGQVGVADLGLVASQWSTSGSDPFNADISPLPTGDGTVNVGDLALVALNWGSGGGSALGGTAIPAPSAVPACAVLFAMLRLRPRRRARHDPS